MRARRRHAVDDRQRDDDRLAVWTAPVVETRGAAWLFENKQLKQVRLRLGVTDGTNIEVIEATPEVKEGTEVVTNVITEQAATTTPGAEQREQPAPRPAARPRRPWRRTWRRRWRQPGGGR